MTTETENALPSVMEFTADVSQQEAPAPLPARTYPAQCTAANFQPGKSDPEKRILRLEFTISAEHYPADYVETKDATKLYQYLVVTDDARGRFRLKKLCETLRVPVGRSLDANDFVGKACSIKVKHGSWEGLPRAEIDAVEAA